MIQELFGQTLNSFVNPVLSVKNLWRALMTNASTSTAGKRNFA
jgi:hypothetical protein